MSKMYVIGDPETGVIFIRLDPWRTAFIPATDITTFAQNNRYTPKAMFDMIKGAAADWIELAEASETVGKPDFCFVADLNDTQWQTRRHPFPPIKDGLRHIVVGDAGYDDGIAYGPVLDLNQDPTEIQVRRSKNANLLLVRKKRKPTTSLTRNKQKSNAVAARTKKKITRGKSP